MTTSAQMPVTGRRRTPAGDDLLCKLTVQPEHPDVAAFVARNRAAFPHCTDEQIREALIAFLVDAGAARPATN